MIILSEIKSFGSAELGKVKGYRYHPRVLKAMRELMWGEKVCEPLIAEEPTLPKWWQYNICYTPPKTFDFYKKFIPQVEEAYNAIRDAGLRPYDHKRLLIYLDLKRLLPLEMWLKHFFLAYKRLANLYKEACEYLKNEIIKQGEKIKNLTGREAPELLKVKRISIPSPLKVPSLDIRRYGVSEIERIIKKIIKKYDSVIKTYKNLYNNLLRIYSGIVKKGAETVRVAKQEEFFEREINVLKNKILKIVKKIYELTGEKVIDIEKIIPPKPANLRERMEYYRKVKKRLIEVLEDIKRKLKQIQIAKMRQKAEERRKRLAYLKKRSRKIVKPTIYKPTVIKRPMYKPVYEPAYKPELVYRPEVVYRPTEEKKKVEIKPEAIVKKSEVEKKLAEETIWRIFKKPEVLLPAIALVGLLL